MAENHPNTLYVLSTDRQKSNIMHSLGKQGNGYQHTCWARGHHHPDSNSARTTASTSSIPVGTQMTACTPNASPLECREPRTFKERASVWCFVQRLIPPPPIRMFRTPWHKHRYTNTHTHAHTRTQTRARTQVRTHSQTSVLNLRVFMKE